MEAEDDEDDDEEEDDDEDNDIDDRDPEFQRILAAAEVRVKRVDLFTLFPVKRKPASQRGNLQKRYQVTI